MIPLDDRWIDAFPIVSIEDGRDENDWSGFAHQTAAHGGRIQVVGDDIFASNPAFGLAPLAAVLAALLIGSGAPRGCSTRTGPQASLRIRSRRSRPNVFRSSCCPLLCRAIGRRTTSPTL